jgi:transposase
MSNERRRYDAGFKARVALEAIKGVKTIAELSSEYKIHSTQIQGWKKLLQVGTVSIFQDGRKHKEEIRNEELVDRLYNKIGQLEVELDFVKKKDSRYFWQRHGS